MTQRYTTPETSRRLYEAGVPWETCQALWLLEEDGSATLRAPIVEMAAWTRAKLGAAGAVPAYDLYDLAIALPCVPSNPAEEVGLDVLRAIASGEITPTKETS